MPPSSWRFELLALVPDSWREVKGEEVKKRGPRGSFSYSFIERGVSLPFAKGGGGDRGGEEKETGRELLPPAPQNPSS